MIDILLAGDQAGGTDQHPDEALSEVALMVELVVRHPPCPEPATEAIRGRKDTSCYLAGEVLMPIGGMVVRMAGANFG
ncbi:hypothetical protein JCM9533A_77990 [Catenuloplanes niger JCM 9533]